MDNRLIHVMQIIGENHNRNVVPIIELRPDLIGSHYIMQNGEHHRIKDAYVLSVLGKGNDWCNSDYIWEGLVVDCENIHRKTCKGTPYSLTFVGSLSEKYILRDDTIIGVSVEK